MLNIGNKIIPKSGVNKNRKIGRINDVAFFLALSVIVKVLSVSILSACLIKTSVIGVPFLLLFLFLLSDYIIHLYHF